jgi:hypothetical protein
LIQIKLAAGSLARGRAAEEREELAPFQMIEWHIAAP